MQVQNSSNQVTQKCNLSHRQNTGICTSFNVSDLITLIEASNNVGIYAAHIACMALHQLWIFSSTGI